MKPEFMGGAGIADKFTLFFPNLIYSKTCHYPKENLYFVLRQLNGLFIKPLCEE
jgi:hypothetical protein